MKRLFLIIIAIFWSLSFFSIVFAQETTPFIESKEKTEEVEKLKESISQKAQENMQQVTAEEKKVGWLGTIKARDQSAISLDYNEKTREILYSEETVIIDLDGKEQDWESLSVGKKVVALGYQQAPEILEARRIILANKVSLQKESLVGVISDKSQVENLIAVDEGNNNNQPQEISITKEAKIIDNKEQAVGYERLEKGQKVALVYQKKEGANFALLVRILEPQTFSETPENLTEE